MLTDLYNRIESPEIKGKDIVLPDRSTEALYLSENGKFFAFTGIYCKDDREVLLKRWPYYLVGKHTKNIRKYMNGLFRIKDGCIVISPFLDHEVYCDKSYKQLTNYYIKMPVANNCYFGVVNIEGDERVENEELTRQCFGLTFSQLDYFLEVYAEKIGISNQYIQYPRLTRSMNNDNFCDITGLWIPPQFPYITFNNDYDFSHVSLYGFYRFIGAMLSTGSGVFEKLFEYKSFCAEIIKQIKSIHDYFPFEQKVTSDLIYPPEVLNPN